MNSPATQTEADRARIARGVIYASDAGPGAKDHKHRWGSTGCKCHQACNNCPAQRRKGESA